MRIRGHQEGRDGRGEEGTEEELSVALGWDGSVGLDGGLGVKIGEELAASRSRLLFDLG